MKKIICFILPVLFLFTYHASGFSNGKISGIVIDAKTKAPLAGVNVSIVNTNKGSATDTKGYFAILNVPPGTYDIRVSMIGYAKTTITNVRVNIDLTTTVNVELTEESLEVEGVTIIAERPVIQKDIASSQSNLGREEIEVLPAVSVDEVVAMEAGVRGLTIRGGDSDQTAFMVNGFTMRDERDNSPYTAVSYTAVEEIKIQTGGFSAEFGNVRSGLINVVTKEGSKDSYHFGFLGRYKPPRPKHFGHSPISPDSYWIRPYVDDDVCWNGTGSWDEFTQKQYPQFEGWNAVAARTLLNDDVSDDLTPEAAQRVWLWEHRRLLDIADPDYDVDASLGGPVPLVGKKLGNLRFFTSYRRTRSMYLVPLSDDAYRDYNMQVKLTSDILPAMKLTIEGMSGQQAGTTSSTSGTPGLFTSAWGIASALSMGPKYIDGRMYGTDYWSPSAIQRNSIGAKLSHAISKRTFYEFKIQRFASYYDTNPGRMRDNSKIYRFGNDYFVDESPFGWEPFPSTGIVGLRMGVGMSNARDSSRISTWSSNFNLNSQLNQFNNLKAGFELIYTDNNVNYARIDSSLTGSNQFSRWHTYPVRAALYVEDKLELNRMIATFGLRLDYSHGGGTWYDYDNPYTDAFSAANYEAIDTLLNKVPTKHIFNLSPRMGVAFPVSVNSKFYFNYGHFRQMPLPENLYLIRRWAETQALSQLANPNNPLPRTVEYELGYEHNVMNMFLVRLAGYYKDSKDQSRLVRYQDLKNTVSYLVSEPNSYQDTRGFELTLRKSRGEWINGFFNYTYEVTTSGYFGFGTYYENLSQQRMYESETRTHYQEKPVPRPFARLNVDFYTPDGFGPELLGAKPLEGWRLNVLADWQAGLYATWTGGGVIPGIQYNVQWRDYFNLDLRFSKNFHFRDLDIEFFLDINNATNYRYMSSSLGFVDAEDYNNYMKSLHLPAKIGDKLDYGNIPGNDRPGDFRTVPYEPYDPNDPDEEHRKYVLENKAYIDMPNQEFFTFLNPRSYYWGLRFTLNL